MKKAVLFIALILAVFSLSISVYADEIASIKSEEVSANAGETIALPVVIKSNPGIMGFRITVNYSSSVFTDPKAEVGSLLRTGMFTDSIRVGKEGTFDVLWSNSENITGDGELFIISFKISDDAVSGVYRINLTNTQDDTFNENWEDVKLAIDPILVNVNGAPPDEEDKNTTAIPTVDQTNNNNTTKQEITVPTTGQQEGSITVGQDTLDTEQAEQEVQNRRIVQSADEVLEEFGVQAIDQIPEEKRDEFVQIIQERMDVNESDGQGISFDDISEAYRNIDANNNSTTERPFYRNKIIILVIVLLAFAGVVIITYLQAIKKNRKDEI